MAVISEPGWMELAENVTNPSFGDDRLLVQFFMEPTKDEEASNKEGRPIFKDREFIRIRAPGQKDSVVREVRDADKARFAKQYSHWKETGEGEKLEGLPLKEWPQVTRSQCEELAFFGVRTVEQLANVADVHAQKFAGIMQLRDKARAYVIAATQAAPVEQLRAVVAEKDNRISTLEAAMEDMRVQLQELRKKAR